MPGLSLSELLAVMITVALIDKYPILRLGLIFCLKKHFGNASFQEANNIVDYKHLHFKKFPDIIIQGINEDPSDLDFVIVGKIPEFFPTVPIIIYDEKPSLFNKIPSLQSGTNGYVLKQNSLQELISCMENLLEGKPCSGTHFL